MKKLLVSITILYVVSLALNVFSAAPPTHAKNQAQVPLPPHLPDDDVRDQALFTLLPSYLDAQSAGRYAQTSRQMRRAIATNREAQSVIEKYKIAHRIAIEPTATYTGDVDAFERAVYADIRGHLEGHHPGGRYVDLFLSHKNLGRLSPHDLLNVMQHISAFVTSFGAKIILLTLSGNGITWLEPGIFAGYPDLQFLDLGHNALTILAVGVFDGLQNLTGLGLTDNKIIMLPSTAFAGLRKLHHISLADNALTRLTLELFNDIDKLDLLVIDGNSLAQGDKQDLRVELQTRFPGIHIID